MSSHINSLGASLYKRNLGSFATVSRLRFKTRFEHSTVRASIVFELDVRDDVTLKQPIFSTERGVSANDRQFL